MHTPVMVSQVVNTFANIPTGVFIDATCGSGGHTQAVLQQRPDLKVLGFDRDQAALCRAAEALSSYGEKVQLCHTTSDKLASELDSRGISEIVGFLMDLGVSSEQLDTAERGFSFHQLGPLDMRMDETGELTACNVVNCYSEEQLAGTLKQYGQERFARRIAAAIVKNRPLRSTTELALVVVSAIPARYRRTGGHPARKSFQAIRIEVNQELKLLSRTIPQAIDVLAEQGRGVFISYHSGEDTIVKQQLRLAETGGCQCPPQLPCQCGAAPSIKLLHRSPKTPVVTEVASNPRSRSAKLRSFEKLPKTC